LKHDCKEGSDGNERKKTEHRYITIECDNIDLIVKEKERSRRRKRLKKMENII